MSSILLNPSFNEAPRVIQILSGRALSPRSKVSSMSWRILIHHEVLLFRGIQLAIGQKMVQRLPWKLFWRFYAGRRVRNRYPLLISTDHPIAHATDFRISWICRFLPLVTFQETCTKVYFGVGEPTCAEVIIANSFLAYVFAEYAVIHGDSKHRDYCQFHRSSLGSALLRLPLLLPASMELVAALTLGVSPCHT